jgi:hypothetical protein
LNRFDEPAAGRIHSDTIDHAELSLSGLVTKPLVDKFAVLIQVQYTRATDMVSRRFIGVIGTFVRMTIPI